MADRLLAVFTLGILASVGGATVTELNFDEMRDNRPSNPSRAQAERLLRIHRPTEAIYCTDSIYPNNIFCDLSDELPEAGRSKYQIADMELNYMDPFNAESFCNVKLKVAMNISPLRFDYDSVSCTDSPAPPPMTRVADLTAIEVNSRRKDVDYEGCVARYENAGSVEWTSGSKVFLGNKPPIKFTIGFRGCYTAK